MVYKTNKTRLPQFYVSRNSGFFLPLVDISSNWYFNGYLSFDLFLLSEHYILINDSICCCQPPFNIPESSDAKMESLGMRKLLPYPILKRTGRSTMVHQSRIRLNNLLYRQLFLCTRGLLSKMTMTMLTLFFFWMSFLCYLSLLHLLLMM